MTRQSSSAVAVGRSVARQLEQLARRDHLMTDAEPRVPERVEQRFGDGPRALGVLVAKYPHVEIACEREHSAAVAADGRERDRPPGPLARHRALRRVKQRAQKPIENFRVALTRGFTRFAPPSPNHRFDLLTMPLEIGLELRDQAR